MESKIKIFIKKHQVIFILLILILFNIHLRSQIYFLPTADDMAERKVDISISNKITKEINEQYPALPLEAKQKLLEEQKKIMYDQHSAKIKKQIKNLTNELKPLFKRDNGIIYIVDPDSYMWYRLAKNVEDHGYPGDYIAEEDIQSYTLIEKGDQVDAHTSIPFGKNLGSINFYPYFIYYWSLLFRPFGMDMFTSMLFISIFLITLAIFPVFFITRRIAGNLGGFVAAIILITSFIPLLRTFGGRADTDAMQIVMPLFILWFLFIAYRTDNSLYKILFSGFSAAIVAIYAYTWIGWSYIFDIILTFFGIYLIILLLTKKSIKDHLKISITFTLVSIGFLVLLRGPFILFQAIVGPIDFLIHKDIVAYDIWPNVLYTIAEQYEMPFFELLNSMGSFIIWIFFIIGLFYLIKNKKWRYLSLFSIFFIVTFYMAFFGKRYVQLNLPVFAILVGIGMGCIFTTILEQIKNLNTKKIVSYSLIVMIITILGFQYILPAYAATKTYNPLMNDAWWNGLKKIDKEAPENAIIASWWDYGHFFTSIGNRSVIFDGGSQQYPPTYWMGKFFATPDEEEAITILRMLNCGGNRPYQLINKELDDELKAFNTVDKMTHMEKEEARRYLKTIIPENTADEIIDKYMFCEDLPTNYLIVDENMVSASMVWAHLGLWNFTKAKMLNDFWQGKDEEFFKEYYNMTYMEANDILDELSSLKSKKEERSWVAPGLSYSEAFRFCSEDKEIIHCTNWVDNIMVTLDFNLTSKDAIFTGIFKENLRPHAVSIIINDTYEYITYDEGEIYPVELSISPDMSHIYSSVGLANSLFNRLLNFNGTYLNHFEPFYMEKIFDDMRIYIWEVKW